MNLLQGTRPNPKGWLIAAAVLAAGLLALTGAHSAQAALPGANGLIAFVSDRDTPLGGPLNDEIYVTDGAGSFSRRLTNDPAAENSPAVSPNGREIAFTSNRTSDAFPNPEGDAEIYVMDANDDNGDGNGDNLRRLTDNAATDSQPAWSPDGKKLVFASNADGDFDLYVMRADGSEAPTKLTDEAPGEARSSDVRPRFSPDGSMIVFASNRTGNNDIWTIDSDGSSPVQLTSATTSENFPDYSPDGSQIAFQSNRDGGGDVDIYRMNAAPESATNPAINLTEDMIGTNQRWPAWSPDGGMIAFWNGSGAGTGTDAEIYVMNAADGSGKTNITNNNAGDVLPDWGPAPLKHK